MVLTSPDDIVEHENARGEAPHEDDKVNMILGTDYGGSLSGRVKADNGTV